MFTTTLLAIAGILLFLLGLAIGSARKEESAYMDGYRYGCAETHDKLFHHVQSKPYGYGEEPLPPVPAKEIRIAFARAGESKDLKMRAAHFQKALNRSRGSN